MAIAWEKGKLRFKEDKGPTKMLTSSNIKMVDRLQIHYAIRRYYSELETRKQLRKHMKNPNPMGNKLETNSFYKHGFDIVTNLLHQWTKSQTSSTDSHLAWEYMMNTEKPNADGSRREEIDDETYEEGNNTDMIIQDLFSLVDEKIFEPRDKTVNNIKPYTNKPSTNT